MNRIFFCSLSCLPHQCVLEMLNRILSSISSVTNQGAPASFKFVIGEKVSDLSHSSSAPYELFSGRARSAIINIPGIPIPDLTSSIQDVSVFVYQKSTTDFSALKKLVSLRHPSILRVLDMAESETAIFIATEHVRPLSTFFYQKGKVEDFPYHGLYQLAKAMDFVREDAKLVHGSLDPVNVFVTSSCRSFRLGGFERSCGVSWSGFESDALGFLKVIAHLLNLGSLSSRSVSSLADLILRSTSDSFVSNLVSEISRTKTITSKFNAFASNEAVQILEYLDSIHVRGDEAIRFLDSLPRRLDRVTKSFKQGVLLETFLSSVLSISSLVPAALPSLINIASGMEKDEFIVKLQPKITQLFSIQDRGIRFRLLAGLPTFAPLFDPVALESGVLFEMLSGLTDSHPSIREQTLRGVVEISNHVAQVTVEKRIVPQITKLLKDPEPSIRTNAIMALHSLTKNQNETLSLGVVTGLRDPSSAAKLAALQILAAFRITSETHSQEICAKYLPLACPLMTDADAEVSNAAFDVVKSQLETIKRFLPQKTRKDVAVLEFKTSATIDNKRYTNNNLSSKVLDDKDFDAFWDDISKPPSGGSNSWINKDNSLI